MMVQASHSKRKKEKNLRWNRDEKEKFQIHKSEVKKHEMEKPSNYKKKPLNKIELN